MSLAVPAPAQAEELPAYLQCVPYAREVSGIQIFGDAHTWWDQAAAKYKRGHIPRVGAVMAFRPHRNMKLGHVAAVSKVIDSRTVLLDHANWSPINGRRGQIERDVKAIDVSTDNDWSRVRVWYDPQGAVGVSQWPVQGFIYADGKAKPPRSLGQPSRIAVSKKPSKSFANAFAGIGSAYSKEKPDNSQRVPAGFKPVMKTRPQVAYRQAAPLTPPNPTRKSAQTARARASDPFDKVVALYD